MPPVRAIPLVVDRPKARPRTDVVVVDGDDDSFALLKLLLPPLLEELNDDE